MDLQTKISYTANWIDGIARSDHLELGAIYGALDRVIQYAEAAKATAAARPREVAKVAIGTDDGAIRAKIAAVVKAIGVTSDAETLATLRDLESTLGAMLPPVTGTLKIGGDATTVAGGA
jgi:hypothetical protein